MHFVFKQAICFDKKDYSRGVHELPESVFQNPIFKKFFDLGLIVEQNPAQASNPDSLLEKNIKLSEKFEAKQAEAAVEEAPKKVKKQK